MMSERKVQEGAPRASIVTTSEERTWAALAHASTVLTLIVGLPTAGLSGIILVFIPLLIYLAYRDKSRFVAFHAAQAFAAQIAATVGFFVAILAGALVIVVLGVVSAILIIILIGILLMVVTFFVALVIGMIWAAYPFVFGGFSIVAAIETANGRDYHYPYVGRWVEDWLAEHEQSPAPAV